MRIITKNTGETPLEALDRYRLLHPELGPDVPMAYAGRLDPMASGALIILIGDECKDKEKYLGLDKEYKVDTLFGIETDTYDVLGLPQLNDSAALPNVDELDLSKYVGKFDQPYPPFSSKTVNGRQLHDLARSNELPSDLPTKQVKIYSINKLGQYEISAQDLLTRISNNVSKVTGDFRQGQILQSWKRVLNDNPHIFNVLSIQVSCSSGTYMRSLAHRIGQECGTGAIAFAIERTKFLGLREDGF